MMQVSLLFTIFLTLFAGCAPETHVNSLTGKSSSKNPSNPGDPKDPDVKVCQHPDAVNFGNICNDDKGACIFNACKDEKFIGTPGYEKYLTLKRYVEKYGGEIYHDPKLCGEIIEDPDKCKHPDAKNFDQVGLCEFEACPISGFAEYEKYLDYLDYVKSKGGVVKGNENLCVTGKAGCMEPAATNFDSTVKKENGTCNFDKCSIPGRQHYDPAFKVIFDAYLAKLAGLGVAYTGSANTDAICGPDQPTEVLGCKDPKASNYKSNATKEDGSCLYIACTKVGTPGYLPDAPIRDAQAAYKLLNPNAADLVSDNNRCHEDPTTGTTTGTTTTPVDVEGCMDQKAMNYDPKATVDNKSCVFKACNTEGTEKYASDKPIRDARSAYNAAKGVSTALVPGPCGGIIGCTYQQATNYKPTATVDDKSCEFKACNTVGTENYLPQKGIRDAYEEYKKKYPDAKDLVPGPCGGVLGCMEPKASNYNANATVEDKSCEFKACNTPNTQNYLPHQPIRDAYAAYKIKYPAAKALVAIACGGPLLNYHLEFGPLPSTAIPDINFSPQPKVFIKDQYGSVKASDSTSPILLESYLDSACTIPTSKQLKVTQNPKVVTNGVVQYAGTKYEEEGVIYLKASTPGLASICGGPITLKKLCGLVDAKDEVEKQQYTIWSRLWGRSALYGLAGASEITNTQSIAQIVKVSPNLLTIDCTTAACVGQHEVHMQLKLKNYNQLPKNISVITSLTGNNCRHPNTEVVRPVHDIEVRSIDFAKGLLSDFDYQYSRIDEINRETTQIRRESCPNTTGRDTESYTTHNQNHLVNPTAILISHENQLRPSISVVDPHLATEAPEVDAVTQLNQSQSVVTYFKFKVREGCKATYQITVAP